MSSPLPRLNKTRRTPLNRHGSTIRRSDEDNVVLKSWSSTRLPPVDLSRQTHDRIIRDIRRESNRIPDDTSLVSSMASRLAMVERELLASKRGNIEKDNKIRNLEERLAIAEATGPDTSELQAKCIQLQKQVKEMEKFLNDYGMIWVGDKGEGQQTSHTHSPASSTASLWYPDSSRTKIDQSNSFPAIDFNKLVANIQQLNVMAGEDTSVVCRNMGGASLKETECVPLMLYKNGLVMFQGPFRPYSDPLTQACIQDLMDGYFPSELQSLYPNGVPFKLSDMRSHDYCSIPINATLFPGRGYTLQDDTPTHTTEPHPQPVFSTSPIEPSTPPPQMGKPLSLDRFLSRIPKTVIKNGKLIDIHDELKTTLQGPSPGTSLTTPTTNTCNESNSSDIVTRLRVRFPNEHSVVLSMVASDTIEQLKQKIATNFTMPHDYIIRAGFPCRPLPTDDSLTLQQCDLVPSCTVFVQLNNSML